MQDAHTIARFLFLNKCSLIIPLISVMYKISLSCVFFFYCKYSYRESLLIEIKNQVSPFPYLCFPSLSTVYVNVPEMVSLVTRRSLALSGYSTGSHFQTSFALGSLPQDWVRILVLFPEHTVFILHPVPQPIVSLFNYYLLYIKLYRENRASSSHPV